MPDDDVQRDDVRTGDMEEADEWGEPAAEEAGEEVAGGEPAESGAGGGAAAAAGWNRRFQVVVGTAVGVLVVAGAAWWLSRDGVLVEPPPKVAEAEPEPEAPPPAPPAPDLPPLDESDPFLRALLAAITDHPDVLAWLLGDDLARRVAVAVDNVADGMSPRRALAGLSPSGSFRAAGDGEELHVHPAAFARYDSVAEALAGMDSPGMASVVREAMPILNSAYAELGRPDRNFAEALLLALDRIAAVPTPPAPVLLEEQIMRYEYRDPALEELDDASKHLLRFGPDNQGKVQEAARGLAERLRAGGPPF